VNPAELEPNVVGLAAQALGAIVVAALLFLLTRSAPRRFLEYWATGWTCLAIALLALLLGLVLGVPTKLFYSLYCFGEYTFGFLLIAGAHNFLTGAPLSSRHWGTILPGLTLAILLPQLSDDLNVIFIPQAAILATIFLMTFVVMKRARKKHPGSPGLRVFALALILLAVDFYHYIPMCAYAAISGEFAPFTYLKYSSMFDCLLEMLLAFGCVMLVLESVSWELATANEELAEATNRLKVLVQKDAMTEALNRHAFYSLVGDNANGQGRKVAGSVCVIDLNGLKAINDNFGHAAGDAAIRAVARSIRSLIRATDLLFRWGGDEFMVILPGVPAEEARDRMSKLNHILTEVELHGVAEPTRISVSAGVAAFSDMSAIEGAIEQADLSMYASKQARRSRLMKLVDCQA
jgi:diguanylate cyclase (GGDEF)-like protein